MHNFRSSGFGHERTIIISEDFFLNGTIFMEDCSKGILKIAENNCTIKYVDSGIQFDHKQNNEKL